MNTYYYNLGDCFDEILSKFSDKTALRYADAEFSFSEVGGWIHRYRFTRHALTETALKHI